MTRQGRFINGSKCTTLVGELADGGEVLGAGGIQEISVVLTST